jgi:hypothetical protein
MRIAGALSAVLVGSLVACGGGGGGGTSSSGGGGGGGGGACHSKAPAAVFTSSVGSVPARTPVALDGTWSYSYQGAPLTYGWSFSSKPAGSNATITGSASTPGFTPDVGGTYTVSLVVTDVCGSSPAVTHSIVAAEYPPTANAGPDYVSYASPAGLISVDGSASSDPNGDPLTFAWTLTPPTGGTATLVDPTKPVAKFTPDAEGWWTLTLVVTDSTARSSYPSTVHVGVFHPALGVQLDALDAAYSSTLDRVILLTSEPALRVVNPHDGTSTAVPLETYPYAVSLSPDGTQAAVSQGNRFSLVNLVDPSLVATYAPVTTSAYDGGDVVLDGRGYAYAFPAYNIGEGPFTVKLADHTATGGGGGWWQDASTAVKPAFDPVTSTIYLLGSYTNGVYALLASPSGLAGSASTGARQQTAGPFLSADRTRVYTGSGDVWPPDLAATIATLRGPGDTATFDCVQDSTLAGKVVAATGGYGYDALRIYDRSLTSPPVKKVAPAVIANARATWGEVRWVFWKHDGTGFYAVFVTSSLTGIAEY